MIESRLNEIKKHSYEGLAMTYEVIEGHDHNTVFKPSIRNALKLFFGLVMRLMPDRVKGGQRIMWIRCPLHFTFI